MGKKTHSGWQNYPNPGEFRRVKADTVMSASLRPVSWRYYRAGELRGG